MSDQDVELSRLLQAALLNRLTPPDVRRRLLRAARPHGWRKLAVLSAAAALIVSFAVGLIVTAGPASPRDSVVQFGELHRPTARQPEPIPRAEAQAAVEKNLGPEAATPTAERAGFEIAEVRAHSDFEAVQIVYARGDLRLSAFVIKCGRLRIRPEDFLVRDGVDYCQYSWRGRSAVAVKAGEGLCRLWVADMPSERLLESVLEVERLRPSLQKVLLHLEGAT